MTGSNRFSTVGISPKVSIPTCVLIALGAILMVLDLTGLVDIDDTLWQALFGAGGVVGGTGYAASPGEVTWE